MVEQTLKHIMNKLFHNSQNGIRSVAYSVTEQVMLELLHENKIGEKIDVHIKKLFDNNAAAQGFSKKFLSLNLFMLPISNSTRREPDKVLEKRSSVLPKRRKIRCILYRRSPTIENCCRAVRIPGVSKCPGVGRLIPA